MKMRTLLYLVVFVGVSVCGGEPLEPEEEEWPSIAGAYEGTMIVTHDYYGIRCTSPAVVVVGERELSTEVTGALSMEDGTCTHVREGGEWANPGFSGTFEGDRVDEEDFEFVLSSPDGTLSESEDGETDVTQWGGRVRGDSLWVGFIWVRSISLATGFNFDGTRR